MACEAGHCVCCEAAHPNDLWQKSVATIPAGKAKIAEQVMRHFGPRDVNQASLPEEDTVQQKQGQANKTKSKRGAATKAAGGKRVKVQ